MKNNSVSEYIFVVYILLVIIVAYVFNHLSVKGLALVFAAILFFRFMEWIRPGGAARYYFCLQLGVSWALVVQTWQHYGWIIGMFAIFVVLLFLPFAMVSRDTPDEETTALPEQNERIKWGGTGEITLKEYDVDDPFYNGESFIRRNGYRLSPIPDAVRYSDNQSNPNEEWSFSFIEKSLSVIPQGKYIVPITLGDVKADRVFDWWLCAFKKEESGDIGLRYKHACVQFPAGNLKSISVVEGTCRGGYWYTLLFVLTDSAVEMSFTGPLAEKGNLYHFAVALSEAWDVPLNQQSVNFN